MTDHPKSQFPYFRLLNLVDRWGGRIFAPLLGLAFPLSLLAPKGLAPLFVLVSLSALAVIGRDGWRLPETFKSNVFLAFAVLIGYGALTALWSIDPGLTLNKVAQLCAFSIGAALAVQAPRALHPSEAEIALRWAGYGLLASTAFLLVEHLSGYYLTQTLKHLAAGQPDGPQKFRNFGAALSAGLSFFSIAIWPVLAWAAFRWGKAVVAILVAGLAAAFVFGESQTATVAAVIGGAVYLLGRYLVAPRFVARALVAAFTAIMVIVPFASAQIDWREFRYISADHWLQSVPASSYHRLIIYSFTAENILERPILGHGLGTSRAIPGNNDVITGQREIIVPDGKGGTTVRTKNAFNAELNLLPLHPHNIGLQLWLELGVPGIVIVAVLVTMIAGRIGTLGHRVMDCAALAGLAAWMVNSHLAFGVWQEWWVSAAVITLLLTKVAARSRLGTS